MLWFVSKLDDFGVDRTCKVEIILIRVKYLQLLALRVALTNVELVAKPIISRKTGKILRRIKNYYVTEIYRSFVVTLISMKEADLQII